MLKDASLIMLVMFVMSAEKSMESPVRLLDGMLSSPPSDVIVCPKKLESPDSESVAITTEALSSSPSPELLSIKSSPLKSPPNRVRSSEAGAASSKPKPSARSTPEVCTPES